MHVSSKLLAMSARAFAFAGPASFAAFALLAGTVACRKAPPRPAAEAATPAAANSAAASSSAAKPADDAVPEPVRKLLGKWLRSDGGYTLELRRAERSGGIEAAYFNPKSIHVSRAIWMQGPMGFQAVVELNDVGYPGATYLLAHDPQSDHLVGQYTQPAMQQTFDVEFVRQPN